MLWINKKWNKTGWFYYIWSQSESEKVSEVEKENEIIETNVMEETKELEKLKEEVVFNGMEKVEWEDSY